MADFGIGEIIVGVGLLGFTIVTVIGAIIQGATRSHDDRDLQDPNMIRLPDRYQDSRIVIVQDPVWLTPEGLGSELKFIHTNVESGEGTLLVALAGDKPAEVVTTPLNVTGLFFDAEGRHQPNGTFRGLHPTSGEALMANWTIVSAQDYEIFSASALSVFGSVKAAPGIPQSLALNLSATQNVLGNIGGVFYS